MSEPFRFFSPEHEALFIQRLNAAIIETVVLPGDGKWHEVELKFDIICPPGVGLQPKITNSGFMLGGGGHAG